MRRFFVVLLLSLLIVHVVNAQPYVTVFEGRLTTGQILKVENYTIAIVQSINGSPYLMLKLGDDIVGLKPFSFGSLMEKDGIKILMGSYTEKGGFLVVSVKPRFLTSLKPEIGARASVDGAIIEVVGIGNNSVEVSINGTLKSIQANKTLISGKLVLEYNGTALSIYAIPEVSEVKNPRYVVFYPYEDVMVSGPFDVPVTVESLSDEELALNLSVSLPPNWKAGFFYNGVEVSEIIVPPRGTIQLILHVEPSSSGTLQFSVGDFLGRIHVGYKGIGVSIPYWSIEAEAGSLIQIPISFEGNGIVEFSIINVTPGWDVYLKAGGYRVRTFEVDGSSTATLVVSIPRNATLGDHKIGFLINGKPYSLDVYVYKTYLGQPARLTVVLRDENGNPLRGWVSIAGKNVTASPAGSVSFELKPGEYTLIAGCEGCSQKTEKVKLSDGEEKTLEITLQRADYYFKAELESDVVTLKPGTGGSTRITIRNLGSKEDRYTITVEGLPSGWNYLISQDPRGESPVERIKLASGESTTLYLIIIPPFNVESGELKVKVVVSGRTLRKTLPLTVRVENPATLTLNVDNPLLTVRAGETTATALWVDSTGTVTNVKFSVQAPSGWDVEVVPQMIPRVGPEMNGNVVVSQGPVRAEVRIRVPKSTPAGTYTVTITAAGDQAKAQTVITVRVTQGSSGAWIGIVLLIAAFGIVVWLMRRVGRR
ncbi:COG1470 family protein [Thermococcus sp.]